MGVFRKQAGIITTSQFDFSSEAQYGVCSGTAATDIIATTSVGLGNITTGMVVTFYQSTGGTCMAGITSGTEYVVSTVTTATSSFQVYGAFGSSAVNISADSTGSDYWIKVEGSEILDVRDAQSATIQVQPTTGWDGEYRFLGSMADGCDSDGRITSSNPLVPIAYRDLGTSSYPTIGTTYVDSTGGTTTSMSLYNINTEGLNYLAIRTRNHIAGAVVVDAMLYRE